MFQVLSILAIVVALWLALMDYAVFRPRRRAAGRDGAVLRAAETGIYLLFLLALALMALSSIVMLAVGSHMHRWMLMLHVSVAPLFAICVTALAVVWSGMARRPPAGMATDPALAPPAYFQSGERCAFWAVVVTSFLTIATAMLFMMSWFGTDWQRTLLNVHRVSAMILMVAATYQAVRLLTKSRATVIAAAPR
jgi:hypothetical protein